MLLGLHELFDDNSHKGERTCPLLRLGWPSYYPYAVGLTNNSWCWGRSGENQRRLGVVLLFCSVHIYRLYKRPVAASADCAYLFG